MGMVPSDHVVANEKNFRNDIKRAADSRRRRSGQAQ